MSAARYVVQQKWPNKWGTVAVFRSEAAAQAWIDDAKAHGSTAEHHIVSSKDEVERALPNPDLIEERFKAAIDGWVEHGWLPTGGFMLAVLQNDLERSLLRGDRDALENLTWFRWWQAARCASAPSFETKTLVLEAMKRPAQAFAAIDAECAAEIERTAARWRISPAVEALRAQANAHLEARAAAKTEPERLSALRELDATLTEWAATMKAERALRGEKRVQGQDADDIAELRREMRSGR